jgi:myo-inositol 2-dehydrogenase/D-chiro-inositol 1-dehydrogenase
MSETVCYGIIGCGMMGQEHIRNIHLLENARIVAIFEPDPEMRQAAKALAPEAVFPDSVDDLIQLPDVNALLIVSPNHMHLEQIEMIAATRPLPLLVEKPLYTSPDQAARVAALQSTYPAPIWVAMEYRYMPPIAKFLNDVNRATGGIKMLTIREHRFPFLPKVGDWNRFNRNTGGTMVEKCCHFFDLMRVAIKSDPVRVMASAGQAINHLDEAYDGEVPDIWDNGYVIVDFANGARAMLELCMFADGSRYQEEISAVGESGKIEALVPGPARFWPRHLGEPPTPKVIVSPRNPKGPDVLEISVDPKILQAGDHNGATFYQHLGFQKTVLQGRAPEVTLLDGAAAVALGLAAQKSASTGQAVEI